MGQKIIKQMQENDYKLKVVNCCDCNEDFEYTVGEQKFTDSLFQAGKIPVCADPKRCRACRGKRKKMFDEIAKSKSQ